jgi:hypothetical protein
MTTRLVPWNGPDCMCYWYCTSEPTRVQVDALLGKMWKHLDLPESFDVWQQGVLAAIGAQDGPYISLFAVRERVDMQQDKVPSEVLGFVVTDISEYKGAYVKYLCSAVETQGVGTLLLDGVLQVVRQTSQHKRAFLNYKPTQELREFYRKRGFLPARVRSKRQEEYDENAEVLLTLTELKRLRLYCCAIHSELGVKMLHS